MSIATEQISPVDHVPCPGVPGQGAARVLHRIAEVRQQQAVSLRSAARHMHLDLPTARHQENPTTDLRLSELLGWQEALDVPLVDLLVEPETALSRPVRERAHMVRVMKTVAAIAEQADSPSVRRLATMLTEQLIEIMPELSEVGAWHSVGQRRSLDDYGRVVERCLREDFFLAHRDE